MATKCTHKTAKSTMDDNIIITMNKINERTNKHTEIKMNSMNFNSQISFFPLLLCCSVPQLHVRLCVVCWLLVFEMLLLLLLLAGCLGAVDSCCCCFLRFFSVVAVNVFDVSELSHHYRCCMRSSAERVIIVARSFFFPSLPLCFVLRVVCISFSLLFDTLFMFHRLLFMRSLFIECFLLLVLLLVVRIFISIIM